MTTTSRIILYWIAQQMPVIVLAPAYVWRYPSEDLSFGWVLAFALAIALAGVLIPAVITRAKARKGEMQWQEIVLGEDGRYHRRAMTGMLMNAGICVAGLVWIFAL